MEMDGDGNTGSIQVVLVFEGTCDMNTDGEADVGIDYLHQGGDNPSLSSVYDPFIVSSSLGTNESSVSSSGGHAAML